MKKLVFKTFTFLLLLSLAMLACLWLYLDFPPICGQEPRRKGAGKGDRKVGFTASDNREGRQ